MSEADSVAQEDCERNEAGEPEHHGQTFNSSDYAGMVELCFCEAHRDDDQVGESNQGNDCAEQQEANLRGCTSMPIAAPPVGNYEGWLDAFFGEVCGDR